MSAQTASGKTLENMLAAALRHQGYRWLEQVRVPNSLAGRQHTVDFVVIIPKVVTFPEVVLVSLKWQGSSGTVEEKVPFEVVRLVHLLSQNELTVQKGSKSKKNFTETKLRPQKAYVVLAGNGWNQSLKNWYISGGLQAYLPHSNIHIKDFYDFMNLVNNKAL